MAKDDLAAALLQCAEHGESAERLACFDAIAASLDKSPDPDASAAPAPETTAADSQPKPLSDDVGKGAVSGEEAPREIYTATVTGCEHNRRLNEFFFLLENGQVWKMSNFRRPIIGECRFDVTIEKDFFGFRMDIPSKDSTFRVSRVR